MLGAIRPYAMMYEDVRELYQLLRSPHLAALLTSHDKVQHCADRSCVLMYIGNQNLQMDWFSCLRTDHKLTSHYDVIQSN